MRALKVGSIFLLALLALRPDAAEARPLLTKSWYMRRGKENVKIKNYKAAIEAYEKAYELDPNDPAVLRGLASAYEAQGLVDKAVEHYELYLKTGAQDADVYFKQGRLLSDERYAYRRPDALEAYRQGLQLRNDPERRLDYADLLNAEKETSDEAIRQYELALKKKPRSARAHTGLAKAYAWNGDQDQALLHSQKALALNRGQSDIRKLKRDLRRGREPSIRSELLYFHQAGGDFGYNGFAADFSGRFDPTPFLTLQPQLTVGSYWKSGHSQGGMRLGAAAQYRFNPEQRADARLTYVSLGDFQNTMLLKAQYELDHARQTYRAGFERELVMDSYLSLVGQRIGGRDFGAARSHRFYAEAERSSGRFVWNVRPFAGWTSSLGLSANAHAGMNVQAEVLFPRSDNAMFSLVYKGQLLHYQRDASGFGPSADEPQPGGYFSPRLFASQTPQLAFRQSEGKHDFEFAGGPSLQYSRSASERGAFLGGADVRASYAYQALKNLSLRFTPGYIHIADVYRQFYVSAAATFQFE